MNRIRALRKEQGMTQAQLAKVLKVSDRTIGFYETGERDPDTNTLKILADFFLVSIDYLLERSDIREKAEDIQYQLKEGNIEAVSDVRRCYDEELPIEAIEEIERFKEFIRHKYGVNKKGM